MYKGSSVESMTPGAFFSSFKYFNMVVGAGHVYGGWRQAQLPVGPTYLQDKVPVGMGNMVAICAVLDLLEPSQDQDIKYIDVWPVYSFGGEGDVPNTRDNRFPGYVGKTKGVTERFAVTDIVAVSNPRDGVGSMLKREYRYHRCHNPRDPEVYELTKSGTQVVIHPVILDYAIADYVEVFWRAIAVDPANAPILREDETVQFMVGAGALARSL